MPAPDETVSVTTTEEIERTDAGIVRRWLAELNIADREEKDWREEAKKLWDMYEGGKGGRKAHAFNILWANTELLLPAVYNSTPQPDVRRRFRDADPVGKGVAEVLERSLAAQVDEYDFDHEAENFVLDMLLTGRGVLRVKYQPSFDPANADKLLAETVECEAVQWDDFRRGPGKRWAEVPWVAFRHDFTYEMAAEKFGEEVARELNYTEGKDVELASTDKQAREVFKTVEAWEIWDKDRRRVLFIAPSYRTAPLLVVPDPLKLTAFLPCPRPAYACKNTRTLVPVPLYRLYQEQARELDRVSARINRIVEALKVRGAYSANLPEVGQILEGDDRTMIPVQNVSEIANVGGLDNAIWIMPIDKLRQVLDGLYLAREQIKAAIYELTGISDIVRGASDPSETASAQKLKAQYGSLRLQRLQREAARAIRDVMRIKAEVIAERFTPETLEATTNLNFPTAQEKAAVQGQAMLAAQAGQPLPPEVAQLLAQPTWEELLQVMHSDKLRQYRVDVETDSTVAETVDRDMQGLREVIASVGEVLGGVAQGLPADVAKEVSLAVVRRARLGGAVEDALENFQAPRMEDDMRQFADQVMGMIQDASKQGAQALKQQDEQAANLQQYDLQVRGTLAQVEQAGAQTMQVMQQLVQQQTQVAQALIAAVERLNSAPVMQNAAEINLTLQQVAAGFQQVIEAVQAPKEVEFVAGRDGVPKGARMKSSKAGGLQAASNEVAVASTTVAAVESMRQEQAAYFDQLIRGLNAGLQAVVAAVERPKEVQFQRGSDGRISGAVGRVQ